MNGGKTVYYVGAMLINNEIYYGKKKCLMDDTPQHRCRISSQNQQEDKNRVQKNSSA
jgi:hypothetical protein